MTADEKGTGVRDSSVDVVEEKCELDVSRDCNGDNVNTNANANANGNAKDDGDGSYVFVSGEDVLGHDHATDLNGSSVSSPEIAETEFPTVKSDPPSLDHDNEAVAVEDLNGPAVGVKSVPIELDHKGDDKVDSVQDCQVDGSHDDTEPESVQTEGEPIMPIGEPPVAVPNVAESERDQTVGETNLTLATDEKENQNQDFVSTGAHITRSDFANENEQKELAGEFPLGCSPKANVIDSEQNLQMAPSPLVLDVKAQEAEAAHEVEQAEVADGHASDKDEDGLPVTHVQDRGGESGNVSDSVDLHQDIDKTIFNDAAETSTVSVTEGGSSPIANDDDASGESINGLSEVDAKPNTEETRPHEVPKSSTVSPAQNGGSFPSAIDPDVRRDPARDISVAGVQLEKERSPVSQAEESVSQVLPFRDNLCDSQPTPEQKEPSETATTLSSDGFCKNSSGDSCKNIQVAPIDDAVAKSDINIKDPHPVIDSDVDAMASKIEVEQVGVNSSESTDSLTVDDTETGTGQNCPVVSDKTPNRLALDGKEETETVPMLAESEEKVAADACSNSTDESEVLKEVNGSAVSHKLTVCPPDGQSCIHESVESKANLSSSPANVQVESGVKDVSITDDCSVTAQKVQNDSTLTSDTMLNCIEKESGGDLSHGINDNEEQSQQEKGTNEVLKCETSKCSHECSTIDASDGNAAAVEVGKKPFHFMVRFPRFDDPSLKEQIKICQSEVDEKTKIRDAIGAEIQGKRATSKEYGDSFGAALQQEKAARLLLKAKRKEIDSLQSVINRVNSAVSIDDIDGKIRNMEHMIQHETLPLKDEKKFIREIKQLKQQREQISSNMGTRDEVEQAMNQKNQVDEQLKSLRKEADSLKENLLKAEVATQAANKKDVNEHNQLTELRAQFRAADTTRQEAYARLSILKKQLYEKNRCFWKYKDDIMVANDLAFKGQKEELQRHCINQVETFMELWNKNDEFRKEYVRCNLRSTVRRLQTLDGRSLGPDEEPPVIPNNNIERVAKYNIVSSTSAVQPEKQAPPVEIEVGDKSMTEVSAQKKQTSKSKKSAKPAVSGNVVATVSGRDENEEEREDDEPKKSKEEEELARKEEELRKAEEEARLREQRRLEQIAKHKEAMERNERKAERNQARAIAKAQKEAEERDRKKEKRARKKANNKPSAALAADGNCKDEEGSVPAPGTPVESKESETRDKPVAVSTTVKRKPSHSHLTKQTKAKSTPPPLPLRNRSKRRIPTWMWAVLISLLLLALFFIGNSNISVHFRLPSFGF
ncbi:hypothetical protein K2173_027700 [Erythroxylum novogranatense]|uniref:Uncharacterized protein n=1 Tax=Erythroxylum novogranatense TaxID=1862640 RepID=A0AAV8U2D4_9ROSI|nr:hypothetical protein K2173_027700 [Erythroxylum novogranatense]